MLVEKSEAEIFTNNIKKLLIEWVHLFTGSSKLMEENDQEFLRALHEEKIENANERTRLVTMKLAFITVLFGLSSVNVGIDISDIFWLLFFTLFL